MTKHFTSNSRAGFDGTVANPHHLTAAGLAIVAATYGLARYCFGLFLPEIRAEFALSSETIGLIAGLSYLGYLAATFAGSWLSTAFEPRLPILLGGLAATSGMAVIGFAGDPWVLSLGVFIAGASPGLAYPPFSDVIVRHTEAHRQNTVYAWINSGTGFGVAFAGPLALYAGEDWRLAWLAFAGFALVVTVWNMFTVPAPNGPRKAVALHVPLKVLLDKSARPLFGAAFLFGVITAVYWTYAVDLLRALTGDMRSSIIFWIVLGVAGISGCFAGGLVDRCGLRATYRVLAIVVGAAVGSLPFLIGSTFAIYVSSAFFGAGFIVMTALFGMWSMRIYRQTPSIGFGFTFFLISLGQGVGPVVGGFSIPVVGHALVFALSGLVCCALAAISPARS